MNPTHSCFISYRRLPGELYETFIKMFYDALTANLANYFGDITPFKDDIDLDGGVYLESEIAKRICGSVCMVIIYTPQYFNSEKPYCARELLGMQNLESKRLSLLPPELRTKGLIIPIIFRGKDVYNTEEKKINKNDTRLYYDFESFSLYMPDSVNLLRNKYFGPLIESISKYIFERHMAFVNAGCAPWNECETFKLPTTDQIIDITNYYVQPFIHRSLEIKN